MPNSACLNQVGGASCNGAQRFCLVSNSNCDGVINDFSASYPGYIFCDDSTLVSTSCENAEFPEFLNCPNQLEVTTTDETNVPTTLIPTKDSSNACKCASFWNDFSVVDLACLRQSGCSTCNGNPAFCLVSDSTCDDVTHSLFFFL